MILVDVNLLLYAKSTTFPQHERAREWLDEGLAGPGRVGLPWSCLISFVRIIASPRLFPGALPVAEAWEQVEDWLDRDSAWVPVPGDRHREILTDLVHRAKPKGDLMMDAHLAALAIEHGLIMASADRDFARFPGLRWENPLD